MAAPYWYLVPFEEDFQAVLDALREREFRAGRYNPVMPKLDFAEPKFSRQYRAAQHDSIEDAIMDAGEEGTRCILDIHTVIDRAEDAGRADFGVASPLPPAALRELYGTLRPTTKTVRSNKDFLRWAFPAQCIYFVVYEDNRPAHVLFAGRAFG